MLIQVGFIELARKAFVKYKNREIINNVGFFIGNIGRTKPPVQFEVVKQVVPGICQTIFAYKHDVEMLNNFLYALSYIMNDVSTEGFTEIIGLGICPVLVEFSG